MKQTTNSILMIRPVAFRMNEQTAVNNYYQKVLDGLLPATVNAKAQQEFDAFVEKLTAVGVDVTVAKQNPLPMTMFLSATGNVYLQTTYANDLIYNLKNAVKTHLLSPKVAIQDKKKIAEKVPDPKNVY